MNKVSQISVRIEVSSKDYFGHYTNVRGRRTLEAEMGASLMTLRDKINPEIESISNTLGVVSGLMYVKVTFCEDGKVFDTDEGFYDLDMHKRVFK